MEAFQHPENNVKGDEDLQLLTPKEVARLLCVTEVCVYQWAKRGIIPCYKVEKCVRFSKDDLRSFLETKRIGKRERI